MRNIRWSTVTAVYSTLIEVQKEYVRELALIKNNNDDWRIASILRERIYAVDTSLVWDPDSPIDERLVSWTTEGIQIFEPNVPYDPFTPDILEKDWVVPLLHVESTGLLSIALRPVTRVRMKYTLCV